MKLKLRGVLPGLLSFLLLVVIMYGMMPSFLIYGISLIFAYGSASAGDRKSSLISLALFIACSVVLFGFNLVMIEIYLLALYGVVLGLAFYQEARPETIFVPTTILLYGTMLAMIFLQQNYLGIDVLQAMKEIYLQRMAATLQDAGMVVQLSAVLEEYGITLLFLVATLLNLIVCTTLQAVLTLRKLPASFELEHYRLRGFSFLQVLGLFLIAYLGANIVGLRVNTVLLSLLIFLLCFYFVQGAAVLVFALKRRKRSGVLIVLMVFMATLLPFAQMALVFAGVADQIWDFRKLEQGS